MHEPLEGNLDFLSQELDMNENERYLKSGLEHVTYL